MFGGNKPFASRTELVNEIKRLGEIYDIRTEILESPYTYMTVCSSYNHCDAKILGIYDRQDKMFYIKQCTINHQCEKCRDEIEAMIDRIPNASSMRCSEIVELLSKKTGSNISYLEVFKNLKALQAERAASSDGIMLSEGLEFTSDNKENTTNPNKSNENTKNQSIEFECLKEFEREFFHLNPTARVTAVDGLFFFKFPNYSEHLRDVVELKIYERPQGCLILGILYDPEDKPIIQSLLLSDHSTKESIKTFLKIDRAIIENERSFAESKEAPDFLRIERLNRFYSFYNPSVQSFLNSMNNLKPKNFPESQFYLIDLDSVLIDILKEEKIPFFIKTRNLYNYLMETPENHSLGQSIFYECNYGKNELLEIEREFYLRRYCKHKIYGLNNSYYTEFEFINSTNLSLPFIDCLSVIISSIAEDLSTRIEAVRETQDEIFPELLMDYLDEFKDMPIHEEHFVDLANLRCTCGKFQEFMFPCKHAVRIMLDQNIDPMFAVSKYYSRLNMLKLDLVVPVVRTKSGEMKAKISSRRKRGEKCVDSEFDQSINVI